MQLHRHDLRDFLGVPSLVPSVLAAATASKTFCSSGVALACAVLARVCGCNSCSCSLELFGLSSVRFVGLHLVHGNDAVRLASVTQEIVDGSMRHIDTLQSQAPLRASRSVASLLVWGSWRDRFWGRSSGSIRDPWGASVRALVSNKGPARALALNRVPWVGAHMVLDTTSTSVGEFLDTTSTSVGELPPYP